MSKRRIVLMNHTDLRGHHFGCARVMRVIEENLAARGCTVTGRIDGRQDWRRNAGTLRIIAGGDAIVINGEGTLHHGRKKASHLLAVSGHPATRGKALHLLNTVWQENPADWGRLLKGFDGLWARDSRSAAAMGRASGREVPWLGDLSTCAGAVPPAAERRGVMVGDSVSDRVTNLLGVLANELGRSEDCALIPLTSGWYEEDPNRAWPVRILKRARARRRFLRRQRLFPSLTWLGSEGEYLERLSASRLLVTGRFHGVCLAIVTGTPFVTTASNTWKIEALIGDAGLSPRRLLARESLTAETIRANDWEWSAEERENIAAFLARNEKLAGLMFDEIAAGPGGGGARGP